MEAIQLAAIDGTPVFGIVSVIALCAFFAWLAASSGASPGAWCLPAGMLVMGVGLLWGRDAWPGFLALGGLLIAVGALVVKGYQEGILPRDAYKERYRRSRRKLPPL